MNLWWMGWVERMFWNHKVIDNCYLFSSPIFSSRIETPHRDETLDISHGVAHSIDKFEYQPSSFDFDYLKLDTGAQRGYNRKTSSLTDSSADCVAI